MEVKEKTMNKLGFNQKDKMQLTKKLNLLIASYHIHYQKLRNFHWNVEGESFFELHDKFEELYNFSKVNIDDVAERIRVFGDRPMASLQEYLNHSKIAEPKEITDSKEMVISILGDFEVLIKQIVEALDTANQIGDVSTIDLLGKILSQTEKYHWMFRSFVA
ncbi:MAG: DNA starvation/stationary phase protection protein [Prolixibacteraceae bacterium]|nr:DNA starvation/stationary phase protection protein [Prolixibacteraceae bacterium]